jgi:hypothetical protein
MLIAMYSSGDRRGVAALYDSLSRAGSDRSFAAEARGPATSRFERHYAVVPLSYRCRTERKSLHGRWNRAV